MDAPSAGLDPPSSDNNKRPMWIQKMDSYFDGEVAISLESYPYTKISGNAPFVSHQPICDHPMDGHDLRRLFGYNDNKFVGNQLLNPFLFTTRFSSGEDGKAFVDISGISPFADDTGLKKHRMSLRDFRRLLDVSHPEYEAEALRVQRSLVQNRGHNPETHIGSFDTDRKTTNDSGAFRLAPHLLSIDTLLKWKDEDGIAEAFSLDHPEGFSVFKTSVGGDLGLLSAMAAAVAIRYPGKPPDVRTLYYFYKKAMHFDEINHISTGKYGARFNEDGHLSSFDWDLAAQALDYYMEHMNMGPHTIVLIRPQTHANSPPLSVFENPAKIRIGGTKTKCLWLMHTDSQEGREAQFNVVMPFDVSLKGKVKFAVQCTENRHILQSMNDVRAAEEYLSKKNKKLVSYTVWEATQLFEYTKDDYFYQLGFGAKVDISLENSKPSRFSQLPSNRKQKKASSAHPQNTPASSSPKSGPSQSQKQRKASSAHPQNTPASSSPKSGPSQSRKQKKASSAHPQNTPASSSPKSGPSQSQKQQKASSAHPQNTPASSIPKAGPSKSQKQQKPSFAHPQFSRASSSSESEPPASKKPFTPSAAHARVVRSVKSKIPTRSGHPDKEIKALSSQNTRVDDPSLPSATKGSELAASTLTTKTSPGTKKVSFGANSIQLAQEAGAGKVAPSAAKDSPTNSALKRRRNSPSDEDVDSSPELKKTATRESHGSSPGSKKSAAEESRDQRDSQTMSHDGDQGEDSSRPVEAAHSDDANLSVDDAFVPMDFVRPLEEPAPAEFFVPMDFVRPLEEPASAQSERLRERQKRAGKMRSDAMSEGSPKP